MRFRYRYPKLYALAIGSVRLVISFIGITIAIVLLWGVVEAIKAYGWYVGGPLSVIMFLAAAFLIGHDD